ncbi:MAG TPA: protein kinase, partial [Planctomycetia bacterium]|nr:protein kinase [Planctomycetia bacterium]
MPKSHPSVEELQAFGLGTLPEERRSALDRHFADCDPCALALARVPDDSFILRIRQAVHTDAATPVPGLRPQDLETEVELQLGAARTHSAEEIPVALREHPRYEFGSRLGEGGMGVIYQGRHRVMERPVAIKVINPLLFREKDAIERFHREVRAAAKLSHPNIVTAFDADSAGDIHFLVMEYVDGISLAQYVEMRGPLSVELACHFVRQAAFGLEHAHKQSMVHRDIKPHNLIVTRKGHVKILDFGLARVAGSMPIPCAPAPRPGDDERNWTVGRMTQTSIVLGTPDYVSPEQARNAHQVDIRADLYSLGCTFYYLLTGKAPFDEGTLYERLLKHCTEEPRSIEEMRPGLPPAVPRVIRKLMAKDPADRYATPSELAAALLPYARLVQPANQGAATGKSAAMDETARPVATTLPNKLPGATPAGGRTPHGRTPHGRVTGGSKSRLRAKTILLKQRRRRNASVGIVAAVFLCLVGGFFWIRSGNGVDRRPGGSLAAGSAAAGVAAAPIANSLPVL